MIAEGKKAPAFALKGSDGTTHALKDYAGKTVVLYFYPKDHTPGCTKEACSFRDVHTQIENLNAVVIGVSSDSLESHDTFIEKFKLPFVLLSDPDRSVMTAYGAFGEKMHYGKLITGVIRSTVIVGEDGKILKHWKKVPQAETHPAKVLEFLEGLQK
ncbi:MAG: peroxiredoxin [Kiritimatiellales bacterium]